MCPFLLRAGAVCLLLLLQAPAGRCRAQCLAAGEVYAKLLTIEQSDSLETKDKLQAAWQLKKRADSCQLRKDSVYARLLHRIGAFSYSANDNMPTPESFTYAQAAIQINTSGGKGASAKDAANNYFNLGLYYSALRQYRRALACYDSALLFGKNFPSQQHLSLYALYAKSEIYFAIGEYQKNAESATLGIQYAKALRDTGYLIYCYHQRGQALVYQHLPAALPDLDTVMRYAQQTGDYFSIASALKSRAYYYEKSGDYATAEALYLQSIANRERKDAFAEPFQLADDYNDYANFLLNAKKDYQGSARYNARNVTQARRSGNTTSLARAFVNMGQASFRMHRCTEAAKHYDAASRLLQVDAPDNALRQASAAQLSLVLDKEVLLVLLNNKLELLLHWYKEKKDSTFRSASLQLALLTDSVITQMRHEQVGEQSKLYWRDRTREFFANAVEACFLAGDKEQAFYFIEKSRAVLLGDKLNELGAATQLPAAAALQEENLRAKVAALQQQLSNAPPGSAEYAAVQTNYLHSKQDLESYIALLEKRYPAYYQYKYAGIVPSLPAFQQYLAAQHQSFVHYFMTDTVLYALGITPNTSRLVRLSAPRFDVAAIARFLNFCSDKEQLNRHYLQYALLAQELYRQLVEPLQLPPGDVVVCTDNFLIPFEALCRDDKGKDFLLYHYNFSYVYAAHTLMYRAPKLHTAAGNFAGFAPVSFAAPLKLVALQQSADALGSNAGYYRPRTLFTGEQATRKAFFDHAAQYSVLTIFSHARADTTGAEPVLYMQDAAITLSELQLLKKPAAQLVMLSACQTNIGKAAVGEGIYSLARGFAAAGIPAVAATMWRAEEQAVYRISHKFNEYLAAGMSKSKALQKAKWWFIQNSSLQEEQLPYYWANMVLIGNTTPITLVEQDNKWWWVALLSAIIAVAAFLFFRGREKKNIRRPARHR